MIEIYMMLLSDLLVEDTIEGCQDVLDVAGGSADSLLYSESQSHTG